MAGVRRLAARRIAGGIRLSDLALAAAILGLLAIVAARWDQTSMRRLDGEARVVDGDTIVMGGQRLRLKGVDAPELRQQCRGGSGDYPCGRQARDALAALLNAGGLRCEGWQQDRYRRLLVTCRTRDLDDVGAALVRGGWAVGYGGYASEEADARVARRGLWAGDFDRPQAWRIHHGGLVEDSHDAIGSFLAFIVQIAMGRDTSEPQTETP